jgi:hypothetical protein
MCKLVRGTQRHGSNTHLFLSYEFYDRESINLHNDNSRLFHPVLYTVTAPISVINITY